MKIVKLENGRVELQTDADVAYKGLEPSGTITILIGNREGVRIKQGQGQYTDIYLSELTATRIDPAIDVAFTGSVSDLVTLLNASFFFDIGGGLLPGITEDVFEAETTTISGHNKTVLTIDTSINAVYVIRAQAICGKDGVSGHAIRYAERSFSVNSLTITPSSSTVPDTNITAGFNNPVMGIVPTGSNIIINLTNATQDTSWSVYYKITKKIL